MIKNILTHWRTSAPGFAALVTATVSLAAMIINHTCTQTGVTACIIGMFTGLAALCSQDYTQGDKAHAESQAQIAELQLRSNIVESGDTDMLKRVPMTPAAVPPTVPPDVYAEKSGLTATKPIDSVAKSETATTPKP